MGGPRASVGVGGAGQGGRGPGPRGRRAGGRGAPGSGGAAARRRSLSAYMAASAASRTAGSEALRRPSVVVLPRLAGTPASSRARATRSRTPRAASSSVPGRSTANSSPPSRATTSSVRAVASSTVAAAWTSRSPAACPSSSLVRLSPSTSRNTTLSGSPGRCRSIASPAPTSPRRLRSPVSSSVTAASSTITSARARWSVARLRTTCSTWASTAAQTTRTVRGAQAPEKPCAAATADHWTTTAALTTRASRRRVVSTPAARRNTTRPPADVGRPKETSSMAAATEARTQTTRSVSWGYRTTTPRTLGRRSDQRAAAKRTARAPQTTATTVLARPGSRRWCTGATPASTSAPRQEGGGQRVDGLGAAVVDGRGVGGVGDRPGVPGEHTGVSVVRAVH